LTSGRIIQKVKYSDEDWQIIACKSQINILVVNDKLYSYWNSLNLLSMDLWQHVSLGGHNYFFLISVDDLQLLPINTIHNAITKDDGISFAIALRETRKIIPTISLEHSIFVERYSRLLPIPSDNISNDNNDDIVLGQWLSRGVKISAFSTRRLMQVSPHINENEIHQIIKEAGLTQSDVDANSSDDISKEHKSSVFSLPGRIQLETFFKEHIIDIVENPEEYKSMGIEFPSAFILQGPPGCGKTYAVEQLLSYLDWPSYHLDSGAVGSPYIHETSKKISELFEQAIENAPSVLVIDEMESFLSSRSNSNTSGGHHIEEVAEFLRKIPDAIKNHVLVIGMTNMIDSIDPAILRRGRFDHILEVGMPSAEEIYQVIEHSLHNLPHEDDINLKQLSEKLQGHPMSDVSFCLKEAARLTAHAHKKIISQETIFKIADSMINNQSNNKRQIGFGK
jgi:SpoVK/Ycf46/Vps4 family AAA+-type ATPase